MQKGETETGRYGANHDRGMVRGSGKRAGKCLTLSRKRRDKMMDRMNRRERFVVKDSELIYYRGAKYRKTLRRLDIAMWVVVVLMAAATLIIEWVY